MTQLERQLTAAGMKIGGKNGQLMLDAAKSLDTARSTVAEFKAENADLWDAAARTTRTLLGGGLGGVGSFAVDSYLDPVDIPVLDVNAPMSLIIFSAATVANSAMGRPDAGADAFLAGGIGGAMRKMSDDVFQAMTTTTTTSS